MTAHSAKVAAKPEIFAAALGFAAAIVELLNDTDLRAGISKRARRCVEERFGHAVAAHVFEDICVEALARHHGREVVANVCPMPKGGNSGHKVGSRAD